MLNRLQYDLHHFGCVPLLELSQLLYSIKQFASGTHSTEDVKVLPIHPAIFKVHDIFVFSQCLQNPTFLLKYHWIPFGIASHLLHRTQFICSLISDLEHTTRGTAAELPFNLKIFVNVRHLTE